MSQRPGEARSTAWICNHSRNTQLALLHGYIDIALTYEREQEQLAQGEGWSVTHGCVFHDHFCLAGPISDPAEIASTASVEDALRAIAKQQCLFHSRADASATMWKEHYLWNASAVQPGENSTAATWYKMSQFGPSEALIRADGQGAYLIIDRSTLLRQVGEGQVLNTTVFFEPTNPTDILMNSCYGLTSPDPPQDVQDFLDYLISPRAQRIIKEFGEAEVGLPLFAPVADGYCARLLKGGYPKDRRWVQAKTS
jgi:tungstate transport system substrate-binding protein